MSRLLALFLLPLAVVTDIAVAADGASRPLNWNAIGMFDTPLTDTQIAGFMKTVAVTDTSASLETRVRSYIDANCAHCHRPGGVRANMDARFDTPLDQQSIINGPLFNELGIAGARGHMLRMDERLPALHATEERTPHEHDT